MRIGLRAAAEGSAVFLFGLLPAFFLAFNVVFSDSFGVAERTLGFAYVFLGYLVVGLVVGFVTRTDLRLQGALLAASAFLLLGLYSFKEPGSIPYHLVVLAAVTVGAFGGVLAGRRIRRPQQAAAPPA